MSGLKGSHLHALRQATRLMEPGQAAQVSDAIGKLLPIFLEAGGTPLGGTPVAHTDPYVEEDGMGMEDVDDFENVEQEEQTSTPPTRTPRRKRVGTSL
eukprot:5142997-Karenia_brevis.AAC.1